MRALSGSRVSRLLPGPSRPSAFSVEIFFEPRPPIGKQFGSGINPSNRPHRSRCNNISRINLLKKVLEPQQLIMFTTIHPFKLVLVLLILAVGQIAATPAPLVNSVVSLDSPSNSNTTIVSANRQGQASAEDVMDDPDYPWISDHNGCDYSHRCLDVEQSRKTWQSSDAQMWSCNRNPTAQRFTIQGYTVFRKHFRITAAAPNSDGRYCLDVPGGNAYEGQSVRWWLCNRESSAAQNWMFHNRQGYPNGWISPLSRPDLCLDPAGGESADRDGQPMILWRCSDRVIHHFKLGNWDSLACRR